MKLLQVDLRESSLNSADLPRLILSTDSSIVDRGRPVFLPEVSLRWKCDIAVAYRIRRLGKTIEETFAERYVDGMTLMARFTPVDLEEAFAARGEQNSPWLTSFDGAVAIGRWIPVEPVSAIELTSPVEAACADAAFSPVEKAVALVSRSFILKTGDIVVPRLSTLSFDASIGQTVAASLNKTEVLDFRIK